MPTFLAVDAYQACVRSLRNEDLRGRLNSALPEIEDADHRYRDAGDSTDFADLVSSDFELEDVSAGEMSDLYDRKMAAKGSSGRKIYESLRLAAKKDRCPLCGHREVTTLDHYMPKASYPALAVNPVNLVPACSDCNKLKASSMLSTLHPYFDDVENDRWLFAEVLDLAPVIAVHFYVEAPPEWPDKLGRRVGEHFQLFGLSELYAAQAAWMLSGMRKVLTDVHSDGGSAAVSLYLKGQAESWQESGLNSWAAVLFQSLYDNEWFCGGGFENI